VLVSLFADRSTMDSAYAAVLRDSGVARDTGDCAVATGAEHRYPNGGDQVGRLLCHTVDSTTSLVWTDDRLRTVAESDTREADDQNLVAAWAGWVGVPAFPTDDEQSLVDLVELSRCERARAGGLATFRDLVAAIDCDPVSNDATAVSYYRFSTVDALRRTYDQHVDAANAPAGVECADGTAPPKDFLGNRSFDLRSVDLGSKLCYLGDRGAPVLEWTIEPLSLMIRATGAVPADLVRWYHQTYGVPLAKVVAAVNSTARPPFPTGAEKALLAHVPDGTANNCLRPPPNQVRDNFSSASTAAVVCGPSPGARVVFYYQFADAAAMNAAYLRGRGVSGGDCRANPPNFAADAPYARGGDTGRLGCGSTGGLNLAWTSNEHAILTYAFQGYGQQELLTWWQSGAGPV
jgi:eukaryotic-like serine/threonine-protein kinase